jgi:preprotein translocase subunit SecE
LPVFCAASGKRWRIGTKERERMSAQRRTATRQQRRAAAAARPAPQPRVVQDGASTRPAKSAPPKESAAKARRSVLTSRVGSLRKLIQDTWAEIKKITWPDSTTARNLTALVIVMSTVLGLLLGGIDFVLLKLFDALS